MSSEPFLDDKRLKKLDLEFQKIIERSGIDRRTIDQVFDQYTLKSIEKLISDRIIDILDFPISTGKEGNVFRGVTPEKKMVAVKIYRITTATFKHIGEYILGDPRFKSIHKSKKDIIFGWTKKEYKNLERLKKIKVRAPKPIVFINNVLVMEYIGEKNQPAPLLKDTKIKNPGEIFDTIIDYIKKMYQKGKMVHGDLSAYNILISKEKPILIDLGQGVLLEHPNSMDYLLRDIQNVVNYFKKYNIHEKTENICKKITKIK